MTPAQLDHLQRLKRHLETLLANAEKRTPGEWQHRSSCGGPLISTIPESALPIARTDVGEPFRPIDEAKANAAFIASCAGNAEAGWKSTLAAIAYLEEHTAKWGMFQLETGLIETILAAWPLESLKP